MIEDVIQARYEYEDAIRRLDTKRLRYRQLLKVAVSQTSQAEVARQIGTTRQNVNRILMGGRNERRSTPLD